MRRSSSQYRTKTESVGAVMAHQTHKEAVSNIIRQHETACQLEWYNHSVFAISREDKSTPNGWKTIIWMRDGSRHEVTTTLEETDGGLHCKTRVEVIRV